MSGTVWIIALDDRARHRTRPPGARPGEPAVANAAMGGRFRDDFRKNGVPMSDPITTLSLLLEPVFAEINGGAPADPTVRPSDRADVQINGALPLAKALGSNPREIAERVIASGALAASAADAEIAGPGFINVNFSPRLPHHGPQRGGDRRPARRPARGHAEDGRRRLLGAERGQGDARRPPPHRP